MKLIIKPVRVDHINIEVIDDIVYIKGLIDSMNPGEYLRPFFTSLHESLLNYGYKSITVDVTELTFINSSGIKEFLTWLINASKLPQQDRYGIILKIDGEITCQSTMSKSFVLLYPGLKVQNIK